MGWATLLEKSVMHGVLYVGTMLHVTGIIYSNAFVQSQHTKGHIQSLPGNFLQNECQAHHLPDVGMPSQSMLNQGRAGGRGQKPKRPHMASGCRYCWMMPITKGPYMLTYISHWFSKPGKTWQASWAYTRISFCVSCHIPMP